MFRVRSTQQGVTLVISMVLLLVVTVLGITIMNVSTVQEKMAAGTRDKDMAFQAAEMALRKAELRIEADIFGSEDFTDSCNAGLCSALTGSSSVMRWKDEDICGTGDDIWQCAKSTEVDLADLDGDAFSKNPKYFIEAVQRISEEEELMLANIGDGTVYDSVMVYRITAIGYGGSSDAKVILQTTYGKQQ